MLSPAHIQQLEMIARWANLHDLGAAAPCAVVIPSGVRITYTELVPGEGLREVSEIVADMPAARALLGY